MLCLSTKRLNCEKLNQLQKLLLNIGMSSKGLKVKVFFTVVFCFFYEKKLLPCLFKMDPA